MRVCSATANLPHQFRHSERVSKTDNATQDCSKRHATDRLTGTCTKRTNVTGYNFRKLNKRTFSSQAKNKQEQKNKILKVQDNEKVKKNEA